jgi:hypothetical protein
MAELVLHWLCASPLLCWLHCRELQECLWTAVLHVLHGREAGCHLLLSHRCDDSWCDVPVCCACSGPLCWTSWSGSCTSAA